MKIAKSILRKWMSILVYYLSFIIKPHKILVFMSFPDYADNPYAFYKYLIEHSEYNDYKKVWILEHPTPMLQKIIIQQNPHAIISTNTIQNWFYVIVCRFIFSSHNSYGYLKFHQKDKLINLWHGMPLKKIGLDTMAVNKRTKRSHFVMVASSKLFVPFFSSAFGINKNAVWVLGQPRIDLLFTKSNVFYRLIGNRKFDSVGIWMPTFRQSNNGGNLVIDTEMPTGSFNYWDDKTLTRINTYLSQTNNFLILKLHPADILQDSTFNTYSNIAIIRGKDLMPIELYPLLGKTDYLLTDYSSVCIDYDVLHKPMGFIIEDIKSYQKGRDFYISNIEQTLPGKVIRSFVDLADFVTNHKQYIKETGPLYNYYKDNQNSKRLAQKIL